MSCPPTCQRSPTEADYIRDLVEVHQGLMDVSVRLNDLNSFYVQKIIFLEKKLEIICKFLEQKFPENELITPVNNKLE